MTTRIDLDGNPYSTEGNLKGVQSSESDLSDLLCCPHCNGNAELKSKNERVGYDEYMRYIDSFYVACSECGARTADFRKKTFAETTEYTVQDFRENPALRAKVEDEYTLNETLDDNFKCICREPKYLEKKMAEEEYTQCKECGNKFPQPIKNRGKGYTENPRTWTIVVNGYCFSCCMKKGD